MVIDATLPFVTGAIAWAWIGERPGRRLILASGAALAGVAAMVAGVTGEGERLPGMASMLGMKGPFALILLNARTESRSANAVFAFGTVASRRRRPG